MEVISREHRLRARIDGLSDLLEKRGDELLRVRQLLTTIRGREGFRTPRCVYCGTPCFDDACVAHRDLLDVDPYYTLKTRARRHLDRSNGGLRTEGA